MERRAFLIRTLAGIAGLSGLGRMSRALAGEPRELAFYHIHTGEALRVVYAEGAEPFTEAVAEISHLLRDFRTDDVHPIDIGLLDTLSALYTDAQRRGRFEVISGYRSPRTNRALRQITSGVAENSLHMSGRAIDVRLTSVATTDLRRAAVAFGRGGVGYYPESNFVHLDTGRIRTW